MSRRSKAEPDRSGGLFPPAAAQLSSGVPSSGDVSSHPTVLQGPTPPRRLDELALRKKLSRAGLHQWDITGALLDELTTAGFPSLICVDGAPFEIRDGVAVAKSAGFMWVAGYHTNGIATVTVHHPNPHVAVMELCETLLARRQEEERPA